MRGIKAKALRKAAHTEAEEIDANPRRTYKQFKRHYTALALQRSQAPKPDAKKPKSHSYAKLGAKFSRPDVRQAASIVVRPLRLIAARLREERTTMGNLTGGRVDHLKKAGRLLVKHELNTLALGGHLV